MPITAHNGAVVAALNIGSSSVRTSYVEMEKNFLPVLREAARKISDLIAHSGASPRSNGSK